MGEIVITVTVEGGFDYDLGGDDGGGQDDTGGHWEVRHEPRCCGPCLRNNDPEQIPYPGCNGNIALIDPDDATGNLCRCKKVWVQDSNKERNRDF